MEAVVLRIANLMCYAELLKGRLYFGQQSPNSAANSYIIIKIFTNNIYVFNYSQQYFPEGIGSTEYLIT